MNVPWRAAALLGGLLATSVARAQQPISEPAPHELLARIELQLDLLLEQQVLNKGRHTSLATKLRHALGALEGGDPRKALVHVSSFSKEVHALAGAGVIDTKAAQVILEAGAEVQAGIETALVLPRVLSIENPCAPATPCEPLVLHVDATADESTKSDGSTGAPYRTIAEALQRADKEAPCGVEIVLAEGTYRESVEVTRTLWLRGRGASRTIIEGSILNGNGHGLHVAGIHFRGSPDPGAIVVDGPCRSVTELSQVWISGATRNGILQRGGTLRGFALSVNETRAMADERLAGAGIRLTDGAHAALGLLDVSRNGAGGLAIEGEDTRVYLTGSQLNENRSNPHFLPPAGEPPHVVGAGIEVGQGALLLAEYTNLARNEFIGLHVRAGAHAHFRYGRIERTPELTVAFQVYGGFNAAAVDGGVLEISGFTLAHGPVGLAIWRSYAAASYGTISDQYWGILYVPRDDFPVESQFACWIDRAVRLVRNDSPVEMPPFIYPEPCVGDCPPPPPCVISVPFICTWCGAP